MVVVTIPDLDNLQIKVNTYRGGQTFIDDQGKALVNGDPISTNDIVDRCMTELRKETRFRDVLDYWEENYQMGLCWKRYDRIEWLSGDLNPDGDELASSWSLKKALSAQISADCRLTVLNFVLRYTIQHMFVSDSRNVSSNLFLLKAF